jgi:hypothetical protein
MSPFTQRIRDSAIAVARCSFQTVRLAAEEVSGLQALRRLRPVHQPSYPSATKA